MAPTAEAGWIVAEEAETGFTANVYGHSLPHPGACNYDLGPHSGFWANLRCVEGGAKSLPAGAPCSGALVV